MAIHGLAYAGVALVLAGVLGFVVFAFGDVGEAWRPLAEVVTAAVLFGTGAFLRRKGAPFVGDALVLLGGLVTPILLVASFVDGTPFPPDLTGRALALVLAPLMLAVGGAFALAARRRADSPLRFLVAPMLWWAAAAAGLALTTSEVAGRDITHPLPWQWALVAVAVAATLVAAHLRPEAPLSGPTRVAAWIGVPLAELVAVAAATAAGGAAGAVLVAGLATAVGVWLLLPEQPVLATNLLGALVLVTAAACRPEVDIGWCAAVTGATLVALVEFSARRRADATTAGAWLTVAAVASLVALTEPAAALTVALVGTAWAVHRLLRPEPDLGLGPWPATIGAYGFPLLSVAAASSIWSLDVGLVTLGVAVTAVAATQRARVGLRALGVTMWVLTQSGVVVALVLAERTGEAGRDGAQVAALLAVAVGLALVPRWRCGRVWLVASVVSIAGLIAASSLEWSTATTAVVAGALALAAVMAGQPRATAVDGHVAAMAHVVGIVALAEAVGVQVDPATRPAWPAIAATLTVGAAGWLVSAIGGEALRSDERDLWTRMMLALVGEAGTVGTSPTATERRPYGSILLTGAALTWWLFVPGALLVATDRLTPDDHWLPVSVLGVALVGVGLGRALLASPTLGRPHPGGGDLGRGGRGPCDGIVVAGLHRGTARGGHGRRVGHRARQPVHHHPRMGGVRHRRGDLRRSARRGARAAPPGGLGVGHGRAARQPRGRRGARWRPDDRSGRAPVGPVAAVRAGCGDRPAGPRPDRGRDRHRGRLVAARRRRARRSRRLCCCVWPPCRPSDGSPSAGPPCSCPPGTCRITPGSSCPSPPCCSWPPRWPTT